jgi:hypothetical protein
VVVGSFLPWALYEAVYWLGGGHGSEPLAFRPASAPKPVLDVDLFVRGADWLLVDTPDHASRFTLLLLAIGLSMPLVAAPLRRRAASWLLAYSTATLVVVLVFARLARTYVAYRRLEFLLPVLLLVVASAVCGGYDRCQATGGRRLGAAFLAGAMVLLGVGEVTHTALVLQDEKTDYREMASIIRSAPPGTTVVLSPFIDSPNVQWDPAILRYFRRLGVDRPVLTFDELTAAPPAGDVIWLTGSPAPAGVFQSRYLNDLSHLQVLAGDRAISGGFMIPAAVAYSHYANHDELMAEAATIRALPFLQAPGSPP